MAAVVAAQQLVDQVKALKPEAEATVDEEQDGLGFNRSVTFDEKTSKWLDPILDVIRDERIASRGFSRASRLTVTFVADTRADFAAPFEIDAVDRVLNEGVLQPGDDLSGMDLPKGSPGNPYSETDAQAHVDSAKGEPKSVAEAKGTTPRKHAAKKAQA